MTGGQVPTSGHNPRDPSCSQHQPETIDITQNCVPCRTVEQEQVWAEVEGRSLSWAANWYRTRRHVMGKDGRALCHATTHTSVFPDGWQSETHSVPPGDSPEVMALQPCGLCTRKVKR